MKERKNLRVKILGSILVLLSSIYGLKVWLTMPVKTTSCNVGGNIYAHKSLNKCSTDLIIHEANYYYFPLINMIDNNDKDVFYTRYNIAGHINSARNFNNFLNDTDLIWVLRIIGKYEEAKRYLNNNSVQNFEVFHKYAKENCYTYDTRFSIYNCLLTSKFYAKRDFKAFSEDNEFSKDILNKDIEDDKNDIIKSPNNCKFDKYLKYCKIDSLIISNKLDLAYQYLENYDKSRSNMYNRNYYKILLYRKLGSAYINNKEYKKAIECYNKILEIQDYNYKAHEKLEYCYRMLGNETKANEHKRIMRELLAI